MTSGAECSGLLVCCAGASVENDNSWISDSFREGMADAEAGRLVDLDTALAEPYSYKSFVVEDANQQLRRRGAPS